MKDLDKLLPRVMEHAANCPEPTALRHLRDAAIEFCRRTRIWRETDTFALGTDKSEVLAVAPEAAIFEITHARFCHTDLKAATLDWLDANEPGWRDRCGPPVWFTQSAPNTVRVVPHPDVAGDLTLQLILQPADDAEQLPDILIDNYARVIAEGALGHILLLPAEFGNAQLAAAHLTLFEDAIGRLSAKLPQGQQRAKRRATPGGFC